MQNKYSLATSLAVLFLAPAMALAQTAPANTKVVDEVRAMLISSGTGYAATLKAIYKFDTKTPAQWTVTNVPPENYMASISSIVAVKNSSIYILGGKPRDGTPRPTLFTLATSRTDPTELPSDVFAYNNANLGVLGDKNGITITYSDARTWQPTNPIFDDPKAEISRVLWIDDQDFLAQSIQGIARCHVTRAGAKVVWTVKDSGPIAQSGTGHGLWMMHDGKTLQHRNLNNGTIVSETPINMPREMNAFTITDSFICSSDQTSFTYISREAKSQDGSPLIPTTVKSDAEVIGFFETASGQLLAVRADGKYAQIDGSKTTITDIVCDNSLYESTIRERNNPDNASFEDRQLAMHLLMLLPRGEQDELWKQFDESQLTPNEKIKSLIAEAQKRLAAKQPATTPGEK